MLVLMSMLAMLAQDVPRHIPGVMPPCIHEEMVFTGRKKKKE